MQARHRTTPTQTSGATISRTSLLWTTTPASQVRNQMSCYLCLSLGCMGLALHPASCGEWNERPCILSASTQAC